MFIFLYLILFFAVIYVVSSMMMVSKLKEWGIKIDYLWLRLKIISYANQYREITKKEAGKTGILYYLWLASINCALICLILFLITK